MSKADRSKRGRQEEAGGEQQQLTLASFLEAEHKYISKARSLWLFATTQKDLDRSEALYRTFLTRIHKARRGEHGEEVLKLLASMQEGDKEMCQLEDDVNEARKRIFLLMCQSGRNDEAIPRLEKLGYVARLSRGILSYEEKELIPLQASSSSSSSGSTTTGKGGASTTNKTSAPPPAIPSIFLATPALKKKVLGKQQQPSTSNNRSSGVSSSPSVGKSAAAPCWITDGTLSDSSLSTLQSVFNPPDAPYWTTHDYCVEPPSPYFSYVFPLEKSEEYGAVGELARAVRSLAVENYEESAKTRSSANVKSTANVFDRCRYAEVWAHNRPHASGHQLHFDSDDEGRGGIRNPVVGSIFYISEGVGGPSLVTDQPFGAEKLASKGWLCFPKVNRLVVFDGTVLHGVVPGKGFRSADQVTGDYQRRVTLMVALWENITTRDESSWGSARPYPQPAPFYPTTLSGGVKGAERKPKTGENRQEKEVDDEETGGATTNRNDKKHAEWVKQLLNNSRTPDGDESSSKRSTEVATTMTKRRRMAPVELDHVWETLEGKAWNSSRDGIPAYNIVFQGF